MVKTQPEDEYDRKLLADIESHGWHLVGICDESGEEVAYVFSVGLQHTFGQPEICLFGLSDFSVMGRIINHIGELMREGQPFEDWLASEDVLEGAVCVFRQVPKEHYQEYFGYCRWYYEGDEFRMLQCVWPDRNGKFPWDTDCDADLIASQCLLATETEWPFREPKNTAVFTTKQVVEDDLSVLYVSHDSDGDWQFLCGTTNDPDDARVVGLGEIVAAFPSLQDLADLPMGWSAERDSDTDDWIRIKPA